MFVSFHTILGSMGLEVLAPSGKMFPVRGAGRVMATTWSFGTTCARRPVGSWPGLFCTGHKSIEVNELKTSNRTDNFP